MPVQLYTFNVHIRWLYPFRNGESAFFGLFVAMRPAPTLRGRAHRNGYGDIAYAPNPENKSVTISRRPGDIAYAYARAKPRKKIPLQSRDGDIAYAPNPEENCLSLPIQPFVKPCSNRGHSCILS